MTFLRIGWRDGGRDDVSGSEMKSVEVLWGIMYEVIVLKLRNDLGGTVVIPIFFGAINAL